MIFQQCICIGSGGGDADGNSEGGKGHGDGDDGGWSQHLSEEIQCRQESEREELCVCA